MKRWLSEVVTPRLMTNAKTTTLTRREFDKCYSNGWRAVVQRLKTLDDTLYDGGDIITINTHVLRRLCIYEGAL